MWCQLWVRCVPVVQVAGVGLEEGLRADGEAGVQESLAHEVGAFKDRGRVRCSGVADRREKSGFLEGKERIGKMRKGVANAREAGGGEEGIKATVVVARDRSSECHAWSKTCRRGLSQRRRQVCWECGWEAKS